MVLGPGPRDKALYKGMDMPTLTAGPNSVSPDPQTSPKTC